MHARSKSNCADDREEKDDAVRVDADENELLFRNAPVKCALLLLRLSWAMQSHIPTFPQVLLQLLPHKK